MKHDEYSYFEIMDRCHILNMNIDDALIGHPALTNKQRRKVEKAQALLGEVYQWASAKCWSEK